jgi:2-phosphosulfolactate phosphatase
VAHARLIGASMGIYDQDGFRVRFEWGPEGVRALGSAPMVVVVVDVLTFSTAVDVAVSRGALVFPREWPQGGSSSAVSKMVIEYATQIGGVAPVGRGAVNSEHPYTLSPRSLARVPQGTRLVVASPNGARVSLTAAELGATVLAGSLRNANAIAHEALAWGTPVAVIASGEQWGGSGMLRPSFEDLVGAGAIIAALGSAGVSPEARAAEAAYRAVSHELAKMLAQCVSGRELIEKGFKHDITWAAKLNVSRTVPILRDGAFVNFERKEHRRARLARP